MVKPALERPVVIGKFTGVHGVAGWLKVMPYTDDPLSILQYQPWYIQLDGRLLPLTVKAHQRYKGVGLLVHIDGFEDRDEAKRLVTHTFSVDRSVFPPLSKGHYWIDLIGLTVLTLDGRDLGKVLEVLDMPAHQVLVVGPQRELIPYVEDVIIKEVRLNEGLIRVDWED